MIEEAGAFAGAALWALWVLSWIPVPVYEPPATGVVFEVVR